MSPETQASEALPSRRRRTPRGGRHRGTESFVLPPGAPPLVLAVPGSATGGGGTIAAELAVLVETEQTGQPALVGHLEGEEASLRSVLAGVRQQRPEEPAAVVVPLLAGPHPRIDPMLREAVASAPAPVLLADPLGPHPQIAAALHERLAEAGLARADRIRMMSMVTAASGFLVVTPGEQPALRQAEVTSVLLASRLAAPVFTALLDDPAGIDAAVRQLREAGANRLALAPYIINGEPYREAIAAAAARAQAEYAAPIGAHPALAELAALRYTEAMERALTALEHR
ncbi:hypothetical protein GCM10022214_55430 [Actinomadura miaoliensis]|uniref:Sirohydrochlorin chelatase n=1 Tax=Actinomadura miaoliensis TaxID=430685 RepID=A0ABP7WFS5_9ACTN